MIEFQLFVWISLSLLSSLVSYFILTEGKNEYLFVTTFFFGLLFGISTSYIWLQVTNGLQMFSWGLILLPLLLSSTATILFLSYYKAFHDKKAFPRIPSFTINRASFAISLVVIVVLSFLLASSYMPSGETEPSIATLGSTSTSVLDSTQIFDASISPLSSDIKIQNSIVNPTSIRDFAYVGEYMSFKIEFDPSLSYIEPSVKVFVTDSEGNLIERNNILDYQSGANVVEGRIYCDEEGTYTITAGAFDLAISETIPMASNTQSYTVTTTATPTSFDIIQLIAIMFIGALVGMVALIVKSKNYL